MSNALDAVALEDAPETSETLDTQYVPSGINRIQEQDIDLGELVPQGSDDERSIPPVPNVTERESADPSVPGRDVEFDSSTPEDDPIPHSSENPDPNTESIVFDDPSESDDGEGEWITPSNAALHKSRAMEMLPTASGKSKAKTETIIDVGCMTADFAMQNVLLQMGLNLVDVEGKRIKKLKTWVLRCHACFKYVSRVWRSIPHSTHRP